MKGMEGGKRKGISKGNWELFVFNFEGHCHSLLLH